MIGFRIFSKKFKIFPEYLFSIVITITFKSTLYFILSFVSKLIWSRNSHWNRTSTQTFHKITYNTCFGTTCYKVFGLKFSLYLKGSRLFRLFKKNLRRLVTFSIKRIFLSKNILTLRTKQKKCYKQLLEWQLVKQL